MRTRLHIVPLFILAVFVSASVSADPPAPNRDQATPKTLAAAQTADSITTLSAEAISALKDLPKDPRPEKLAAGMHFLVSNEMHIHHYEKASKNRKGAYLGVGTDQNFLLAGWSNPYLMVLLDFDQWVVDLQHVYAVAFHSCETSEEFRAFWSEANRRSSKDLVRKAHAGSKRLWRLVGAYNRSREKVAERLEVVTKQFADLGIPIYLSDPAMYSHLRSLYLKDQVFIMRGDLTGSRTLAALNRITTAHRVVFGLIYVSNSMEYFHFDKPFRRNMLGLPTNDSTLFLHTVHWYADNKRLWTYFTQRYANFRTWLEHSKTISVRQMLPRYKGFPDQLVHFDQLPSANKRKR